MSEIHTGSSTDRRVTGSDMPPESERRSGQIRDLDVRVEQKSPKHFVLYVANEFVSQNHCLLDDALGRLLTQGPGVHVELDISRVPYADSLALGRLIFWSKRFAQAGCSFGVVNPTPYITGIMEIMRLELVVTILHRHAPAAGDE